MNSISKMAHRTYPSHWPLRLVCSGCMQQSFSGNKSRSEFNNAVTTDHKFLPFKDSGSRSFWKVWAGSNVVMVDRQHFFLQEEFHSHLSETIKCYHFLDEFKNPPLGLMVLSTRITDEIKQKLHLSPSKQTSQKWILQKSERGTGQAISQESKGERQKESARECLELLLSKKEEKNQTRNNTKQNHPFLISWTSNMGIINRSAGSS